MELKIRGQELKAKEKQLRKDQESLDEAWKELRMEKEKVNDAALRVELQEEEVEKVSRASALWFTAMHRLAAQLGFHTLHESRSCPGRGIRGHIEEPCPRAARIPVPNLLSHSALQLLAQKIAEAHRIESEHQARLQDMLQNLEQLKQQQQRLHQGSVPSAQDLGAPSNGPSSAMGELSRVLWVGRDVLGDSCACTHFSGDLGCSWGVV